MSKRFGIVLVIAAAVLSAVPAGAADIVGRGSLGVSGGAMLFTSGDQFGEGSARPIGHVMFKYNFTGSLAAVLESGFGWNAYTEGDQDTLATVIPSTLGLEFRKNMGGKDLWPHLGFGGGLYSLGVKDTYRSWAYGNDGRERLTWTSFGVYGKVGSELLFDNGVSMNLDFLYHQIFSEDLDRFPDRWGNQNTAFIEARLGVNYYFTLKSASPAPPGE